MKKFIVIIENKNNRTKSHTSINAYNVWNRNWQIVDKQMIFELCYIEAIIYTNERKIDIRASHTEHLLIAHQAIYYRTIASLMQFTM